MTRRSTIVFALALAWVLGACSEDSTRPAGDGGGGGAGKEQLVVNDSLLGALEVRYLKGRCVGRVNVNANDAESRAAVVAFTRAVVATIPLDGSKPQGDAELVALVPADNVVEGWAEDPADSTKGPWLITTTAFDWINGGGGPFADNGFEAAAGERYLKSGKTWELGLEIVNMGSTAGAEAAFTASQWDQGSPP